MTDADDSRLGAEDIDALFEALLAGHEPASAPGWSSDLAVLVHAAQAAATPDELAREDDIVARMRQARLEARSGTVSPAPVTAAPVTPAPVADLAARRVARGADRGYRAKHAAARLERSRHPAVRTIGRVVAMKAAAVTTVAVISVAAAAAATTGIVATVVVPALSPDEPRKPEPTTTTTERRRPTTTTTPRATGWADTPGLGDCPMLPACPDAAPTVPPSVAPTTPTTTPTTTSAPSERTTTAPTTTTTAPPATSAPTTATTAPPPSTTVPEDTLPDPVEPLAADTAPGRGRSAGAAHGSSGRG